MSKAAELAKMGEVIDNGQIGGRRNIIINGDMQISQRATSASAQSGAVGYPCLDRFRHTQTATDGRYTVSQESITDLEGFGKCLKIACTTADTSIAATERFILEQRIEGFNLQGLEKGFSTAKSVTVSFYVKGHDSATYVVALYDVDNDRFIGQTFNVTSSWASQTVTFAGDTTGKLGNDNTNNLALRFYIHAGSNYTSGTLATSWGSTTNANTAVGINSIFESTSATFFLTGVQLEVGSTATPFEHRSYGEELALCQRYFYRWESSSTYAGVGVGRAYDTSNAVAMINTPCAMRANATLTVSAVGDFAIAGIGGTPASISNGERTTDFRSYKLTINQGSTPFTSGTIYQLESDNQANAKINFDSEL